MGDNVIPLADLRYASPVPRVPAQAQPANGALADRLGRPLHDLRISVTDRCNFRCSYCMPKEVFDSSYKFLPQTSLLSFEEITRTARIFATHGVEKLRLTGGEPLLRRHIEQLVAMLAALRTPGGKKIVEIATGTFKPKKEIGFGGSSRDESTASKAAQSSTTFA